MEHAKHSLTDAFASLKAHFAEQIAPTHLKTLLQDEERAAALFKQWDSLVLDMTHSKLTPATLELLLNLAEERKLHEKINAMFSGNTINRTEHRAVLHTALRASQHRKVCLESGENVVPAVHEVLKQVQDFS